MVTQFPSKISSMYLIVIKIDALGFRRKYIHNPNVAADLSTK